MATVVNEFCYRYVRDTARLVVRGNELETLLFYCGILDPRKWPDLLRRTPICDYAITAVPFYLKSEMKAKGMIF